MCECVILEKYGLVYETNNVVQLHCTCICDLLLTQVMRV